MRECSTYRQKRDIVFKSAFFASIDKQKSPGTPSRLTKFEAFVSRCFLLQTSGFFSRLTEAPPLPQILLVLKVLPDSNSCLLLQLPIFLPFSQAPDLDIPLGWIREPSHLLAGFKIHSPPHSTKGKYAAVGMKQRFILSFFLHSTNS